MSRQTRRSDSPTYRQVQQALSEQTGRILEQIPLAHAQLSLPLDGTGPRICVSVRPGEESRVPKAVRVDLGEGDIEIPLQVAGDWEAFRAL